MDFNLKKEIKSKMFSYYKAKSKKKSDSSIPNYNNNALYVNDLFNKSLKVKSDLKFRTSKNSPLYTKRKIEVNEDMNSGIFAGGRLKNSNNEDLFSKKIKKLYKKSGNYSQLHNNSSNLINNNSKNESSSITANKLNKTKKLFYNNYNNSNFDYNDKLNYYNIINNSSEENNNNGNNNISSIKQKKNFKSNLGLIKHLENKETKVKNEALFKKISNNDNNQIKHQSVNKAKKITNINYIYKNNNNNYSKYLKKYNNDNSTSAMNGVNIINKKLDKIIHNNDYNNSFLDYNKLSKTAYLSKNNSNKNSLEKKTNIKNNYNIYFINSKLIQRNDDKNINSINNINNNESSRVLYDSVNKKIKNINELNSSNNKSSNKGGNHNYSQIYILDSNNKNNAKIVNEENNANNIKSQKNNRKTFLSY